MQLQPWGGGGGGVRLETMALHILVNVLYRIELTCVFVNRYTQGGYIQQSLETSSGCRAWRLPLVLIELITTELIVSWRQT